MGGIQAKEGSIAEVHSVRGGQLILRVAPNLQSGAGATAVSDLSEALRLDKPNHRHLTLRNAHSLDKYSLANAGKASHVSKSEPQSPRWTTVAGGAEEIASNSATIFIGQQTNINLASASAIANQAACGFDQSRVADKKTVAISRQSSGNFSMFNFLIGPLEGRSYLLEQSVDILEQIFAYLTPRELALLSLTCRSMNVMVNQYLNYCINSQNLRVQYCNFYTLNVHVLLPHEIDLKNRLDSNSHHELLLFSARHQFQGRLIRRHPIAAVDRFDLLPKPVQTQSEESESSHPPNVINGRRQLSRVEGPVVRERDVALKRDVVVVKSVNWLYFRHAFPGIGCGKYVVRFRIRLSNVRWGESSCRPVGGASAPRYPPFHRLGNYDPVDHQPFRIMKPVKIRVHRVIKKYAIDSMAERKEDSEQSVGNSHSETAEKAEEAEWKDEEQEAEEEPSARKSVKTRARNKRLVKQTYHPLLTETISPHWWSRIESCSSNHISSLVIDSDEQRASLAGKSEIKEHEGNSCHVVFDRTSDWFLLCTRPFSVADEWQAVDPNHVVERAILVEFDDRANCGHFYSQTIDDSNLALVREDFPSRLCRSQNDGSDIEKRGIIWDFVEIKSVD